MDLTGGTWFVGGCDIFATALKRYLGDGASLWSLNDMKTGLVHVVVKIQGCFLDADGVWSHDGLLKEWSRPWRRLVLRKWRPNMVGTCPVENVKALLGVFQEAFGDPSWLTE
jgi:hypothetical protein